MKIDNNSKVDILIKVFEEKNKSVNIIRDRVQTISIWIAGLMFAGGAFILQFNLNSTNSLIIGVSMTILIGYIRFFYFSDLERGFNDQRTSLVKVEKELGLFKKVYPAAWEKSGTKEKKGKFFLTNYLLLEISLLLFLIFILFQIPKNNP